jgi:hypothetical protein
MKEPEISAQARNDPVQSMALNFMGLNLGVDDRVTGTILASNTRDNAQGIGPRRWYKCGVYISFGEYKLFPVPEKEGMTVGML